MRPLYQRLAIIALLLAVYIPSITAGLCYVDDRNLMDQLLNRELWNLKDIFFPGAERGLYYRPLIELSYVFDRFIWFADERFMHLENILLHVLNSLLVYTLARLVLAATSRKIPYAELFAALAFGLHPLNTESVNWICGRSDILACTFVLISAIFVIKYRDAPRPWFLVVVLASFIAGIFVKEVAVAFLPGIFLLLGTGRSATVGSRLPVGKRAYGTGTLLLVAGFFVLVLLAVVRKCAFSSTGGGIPDTISYIAINPVHSIFIFLRAFGFYFKKLFVPFPLNFSIYEVDPLYELLALPCIIFCWAVFLRRSLVSAVFTSGVLLVIPSFLISLNRVAWTAFAERYMYVPSAFIMIATALALAWVWTKYSLLTVPVVLVPLGIWTFCTMQRNLIWHDNRALLVDSVTKNPQFHSIVNKYGQLLLDQGDLGNAQKQFEQAYALFPTEEPLMNLGEILVREGKLDEALHYYRKLLHDSKPALTNSLNHIIEILEKQLLLADDPTSSRVVMTQLLEAYRQRDNLKRDPHSLYRMAQLTLALGDRGQAASYLQKADHLFSSNDPYKAYAKKLSVRLAE